MAIALHHSRAKGTAKVILIGIANHLGDGGSWPSMATLARYGGCTVDQARKIVRRLEDLKEIAVAPQAGGLAATPDHMRPNLYDFRLRCPADCDGSMNHRSRSTLFPQFPHELSTPPANLRGGTPGNTPTPYASLRGEPYIPKPPVKSAGPVPNRARAGLTYIDHLSDAGTPCHGEMITDRHCAFGHIVRPTEAGPAS